MNEMMKRTLTYILLLIGTITYAQNKPQEVPANVMQNVYDQVKTPYKYGLVIVPSDDAKKMDCPSVFRKNDKWYMTYIVFDGRGYETWLSGSDDLLHWKTWAGSCLFLILRIGIIIRRQDI